MTEPVNGTHPGPADLQAFADGEALGERVAGHVESCAVCRAEVAAIQRVTAALSLGSKPPDTLLERIRERRAGERTVPIASRRERANARRFMLPLGLAAAAVLAIILPRALREPVVGETPTVPGAKGVTPAELIVQQAIVTESGPGSIDSISWEISDATGPMRAELRYLTGVTESARAELLAKRVAQQLRASGMTASSITLIPVPASPEAPPAGAVAVTIRSRPPGPVP